MIWYGIMDYKLLLFMVFKLFTAKSYNYDNLVHVLTIEVFSVELAEK